MKKFILATHNEHKRIEIGAMLAGLAEITDLKQMGLTDEIPETGITFEENAMQKAEYVWQRTGQDCFADDSGLSVEALGGEPGVWSARYAGEPVDMDKNIAKLLAKLKGETNRKARFVTVIAVISGGEKRLFRGTVEGTIIDTLRGTGGFGYDPIFVPDGYTQTFAELSADEKNKISHRANAVKNMVDWLKQNR